MNILPRLSYLFTMLPLRIDASVIRDLTREMKTFIWAGRKPHLKLRKLQAAVESGGLRLPNREGYWLAFQIAQIKFMLHPTLDTPRWVHIERALWNKPESPLFPLYVKGKSPTRPQNPILDTMTYA